MGNILLPLILAYSLEVRTMTGETAAVCEVEESVWTEVCDAFDKGIALRKKVQARLDAYNQFAAAMGYEEVPMSAAPVKTQISVDGQIFFFEGDGELWCDSRFILPHEEPIVRAMESYYRAVVLKDKKLKAEAEAAAAEIARRKKTVPVFKGFEDARYQKYDELILKYAEEFNANRAHWADATPSQASSIRELRPALIKSHMIEESGGGNMKSRKAWMVDPVQVNVPGDWDPNKKAVGLNKPSKRNEGSAAKNVKAAIMYLVRKGFGPSGGPAKKNPEKRFDGWFSALKRYNGRKDLTASGKRYKDAYAERIIRRAESPKTFVPIAKDIKQGKAKKKK